MEKKNYLDHVNEFFNKNQTSLNNILDSINSHRNITGYEEIKDSTHRAFNACVSGVKYFSKNNINYIDEININSDKIAMEAWEKYIMSIYKESINEMTELRKFISNKSDDIVKRFSYKSRKQQRKIYNKLINVNPYMMGVLSPLIKNLPALKEVSYFSEFKDGRVHVANYNEICEKISSLDPEKDLLDSLKYYLKFFYDYVKNQKYEEDFVANSKRQHDQVDYIYKCMLKVLIRLHRPNDAIKLTEFYLGIIKDEALEQQEYLKEKYEEFKTEVNNPKVKQLKK